MNYAIRRRMWSAALIVAFFLGWEVLCLALNVSDLVVPRPSQVMATLVARFPVLWPHIIQTLWTTMIGFGLGVAVGVVIGALIGTSRVAYDTAYPLLIGFSSIPKVAVVPIFVLWFGAGPVPAVLTALAMCFFPIVVNIATGLATTEPEMEDVLKSLGVGKMDLLLNVGLPRTMPFFFASLKIAATYAFVGTVLAETVASNKGIGNVMMSASSNFDVPLVFAGLFILAFLGVALYVLFSVIEGRVVGWANRRTDLSPPDPKGIPMLKSLLAAASLIAMAAPALAQTDIRFTLGWKTQGSDAPILLAQQKGYFEEEGLNVTIDQGEGSAATVTRIMSGTYDAGFGDINAIIQNAAERPDQTPVMVYQLWNDPPFTVVTRKESNITTPADLAGKTLGGAPGTPTTKLLPVFARMNDVDLDSITIESLAPNLTEPMLIRGDIDGAMVFNITAWFNLINNRQDPAADFNWLNFGDHGLDLYANGVMVSQAMIADNPEAVTGLVRAINRAAVEIAQDHEAGVDAVLAFDNLANRNLEMARMVFSYENLIASDEVTRIGLGDLDDDRLSRAIDIVAEGYQLQTTPAAGQVFDRSFLPPLDDRQLVLAD